VRFGFVRDHRETFRVRLMCRVLDVSHSGFYAWVGRDGCARDREDARLEARIRAIYDDHRFVYGAPRIHKVLQRSGVACSRKRVAKIMRRIGLRSKATRRFRIQTTNSKHDHPIAPDLLKRNFTASAPNRAWVSDITYIGTDEGWLYLAVIMDLFSRRVVGWSMGSTMDVSLVTAALDMAVEGRRPDPGCIFHSDRGSQYACTEFRAALKAKGLVPSMSRRGDCYDNAAAESLHHSLKTECVLLHDYKTRDEARASVFDYIVSVRRRRKPPMDPARATAKLPTCAESTLDRGLPVATHWRRGTPKPSTCSVRAA
jgi:transposase InsO family protein